MGNRTKIVSAHKTCLSAALRALLAVVLCVGMAPSLAFARAGFADMQTQAAPSAAQAGGAASQGAGEDMARIATQADDTTEGGAEEGAGNVGDEGGFQEGGGEGGLGEGGTTEGEGGSGFGDGSGEGGASEGEGGGAGGTPQEEPPVIGGDSGGQSGGSGEAGNTGEAQGGQGQGGDGGGSGDQGQGGGQVGQGDDQGGQGGQEPGGQGQGGGAESPGAGGDDQPQQPAAATLLGFYLFYENYVKPTWPLAYNATSDPLISTAKGTMELYAQSEFSNGNIGWVDDTGVGVVWSIQATYDEAGLITNAPIAEIDRATGTVRALGQGNGQIVVRCQAQNYEAYAEMIISIKGNSEVPYLTDLQICDETGIPYDYDAEIRIDSADFGLEKKFNLRASYHDPVSNTDFVKETVNGDVVEGAIWTVSGDARVSYVNIDTGAFIAQATGSVRLTCSVTGAGLLGDTLADYVFVLCGGDMLDPDRDYNPADELKVVVKYATEDKQGIGGESDYEEARTWYYSPSELEALGVTQNLYTLVKSSGTWGTMKAHGVYFQRLIEDVINADDFSLDMIKGFYFGATDDYNPGFVGEAWLFETQRYYFPNMSLGSGNLNAIGVAPMIATQTVQEDLVDEPSGPLSEQTRFRLCLGAESTTVNNAQQSIYNIYKITIILNGAPPVGWDEPAGGHATSTAASNPTNPGNATDPSQPQDTPEPEPSSPDEPQEQPIEQGGTTPGGADVNNAGGTSTTGGEGLVPVGPDAGTETPDTGVGGDPASTPSPEGDPSQPSSPDAAIGSDAPSDVQPQAAQSGDTQPQQQPSSQALASDAGQRPASQVASSAQQAAASQAEMQAEASEATEQAVQDMLGDPEHRYQVYEMMTSQPALFEALQLENPLTPFVVPGLLLVALLGGAQNWTWFRRQTGGLTWPPALRGAVAAALSGFAR